MTIWRKIERAILEDKLHIIKKYHKLGANLSESDGYYLRVACRYAKMRIIDYLLENGGRENKKVVYDMLDILRNGSLILPNEPIEKVIAKLVHEKRKYTLKELLV